MGPIPCNQCHPADNTIKNVIGGSLNDTLTGNMLANKLMGGPGNDTYLFDTDLALESVN